MLTVNKTQGAWFIGRNPVTGAIVPVYGTVDPVTGKILPPKVIGTDKYVAPTDFGKNQVQRNPGDGRLGCARIGCRNIYGGGQRSRQ
jgi:hypothetical protein